VTTDTPTGQGPEIGRFEPIFPVRDLRRSLEHYKLLGFDVDDYEEGDEYSFARRDGNQLHLTLTPDMDPLVNAACVYFRVDDAAALAAEWRASGAGGTGLAHDTDYGMCESAHVDPDNNMIKFGSRITQR
jgi:predicted enzyme related to lactoylglutathione lyase